MVVDDVVVTEEVVVGDAVLVVSDEDGAALELYLV